MNSEHRVIIKNAFITYSRLIITTIMGLLSSRFVLQALGASDYGLYNVVGGIIVVFSFISNSLSTTTQRFLNYEMGKGDECLNKVFNISITLHILLAIISFISLEIIGLWYIENYLNVEPGKEADAIYVFQISTIVSCIGIINVPFQSLFIAKQKFAPIAIIDIISQSLKLGLVIYLAHSQVNALRLYALGIAIITFASQVTYLLLSQKKWPTIIKWRFVKGFASYKKLIVFNNYNTLYIGALLLRNQGSNIIINYFFGTIVNAAYTISFTVQNYINMVVGCIDITSAPQITQHVGIGNYSNAVSLTSRTCRFSILLMLIILLPIISELDFILHLWLGTDIPIGTTQMCYFAFLFTAVSSTSSGIQQLINAIGDIKWFTLQYAILYLFAMIVSIFLFYLGYKPYYIFITYFMADLISRIFQLFLLKRIIGLKIKNFVVDTFLKPLKVMIICLILLSLYKQLALNNFIEHFLGCIIMLFFGVIIVLIVGLTKEERRNITRTFNSKIQNVF